jgi:hypothetical protein
MTFLDKQGTIKLRFFPLIWIIPAIGGISYGASLDIGPAIGLFFLCVIMGMTFVAVAVSYDRIKKLEGKLEALKNASAGFGIDG